MLFASTGNIVCAIVYGATFCICCCAVAQCQSTPILTSCVPHRVPGDRRRAGFVRVQEGACSPRGTLPQRSGGSRGVIAAAPAYSSATSRCRAP
jgi:hypothetical protein